MSRNGPAGKYSNFNQSLAANTHSASAANTQNERSNIKTLKCMFCQKEKPLDAFSATQIQKASYCIWAPASFNKKEKRVRCKQCTPGPTTHMTCHICSNQKPLDKFAKNQRKNHDKARCFSCSKKRDEENIWDSADEDTDDDDDELL